MPIPPGMKRMWMGCGGGDVNVCVGRIFCSKGGGELELELVDEVETGDNVDERIDKRSGISGYNLLIVFKASKGPKTSKA